jgi:hypothetical protein
LLLQAKRAAAAARDALRRQAFIALNEKRFQKSGRCSNHRLLSFAGAVRRPTVAEK